MKRFYNRFHVIYLLLILMCFLSLTLFLSNRHSRKNTEHFSDRAIEHVVDNTPQSGSPITSLYFSIICDIMSQAKELDTNTQMIALDLTQVFHLTSKEQSTLVKMLQQTYDKYCFLSTYENLVEKGLIPLDDPYFTDGVLITIIVNKETEKSFSFSLSKWRDVLHAIEYNNCTARLNSDTYSYTLDGLSLSTTSILN